MISNNIKIIPLRRRQKSEKCGVFLYQSSRKCLWWPFTPLLAATCRRRLCRFFSKKTQPLMGKSGDTRPSTGHTRDKRINLEYSLSWMRRWFGFSESMTWKIQIYFYFSLLNTHLFVGFISSGLSSAKKEKYGMQRNFRLHNLNMSNSLNFT